MSHRFFVENPIDGLRAELVGAEARHATRVMRCGVGDEVTVFDGSGAEFRARVREIGREGVALEIVERQEVDRELGFELVLGVALPKGERQRWLVEKAVELGVSRLVPLKTERGVAQPVARAVERLRTAVIQAAKQCGRNRLMEVATPAGVADFCAAAAEAEAPTRVIATPGGQPLADLPADPGAVWAAVGPEGGFTPHELTQSAAAGFETVSLGAATLRVETAAVALAAFFALRASRSR